METQSDLSSVQGQVSTVSPVVTPLQNSPSSANVGSGFFQEDNGSNSSMRLMCFIALLAAIVFGTLSIVLSANGKGDGSNGTYITFGFLISAFAPKAVQKFAEQKVPAMGSK